MALRSRYGSTKELTEVFSPARQFEVCDSDEKTPSLSLLSKAYNENIVVGLIALQLFNVSEYAGCKGKMSGAVTEETARQIARTYSFLSIAELMDFCLKFKRGEYGHFYGAVDPMVILQALSDYCKERSAELCRREYEKENEQRERHAARCKRDRAEYRARIAKLGISEEELPYDQYGIKCCNLMSDSELLKIVKGIDEEQPKA